jgi:hypothetical protein
MVRYLDSVIDFLEFRKADQVAASIFSDPCRLQRTTQVSSATSRVESCVSKAMGGKRVLHRAALVFPKEYIEVVLLSRGNAIVKPVQHCPGVVAALSTHRAAKHGAARMIAFGAVGIKF